MVYNKGAFRGTDAARIRTLLRRRAAAPDAHPKRERHSMKSRWLSTFTLIGLLLLVLGAVGLVFQHSGAGFVFDPGQPPSTDGQDRTALYYLVIGALMVLNGLVTPAPAPGEISIKKTAEKPGASASVAPVRPSGSREVVATSADTPGEQI